MTEEQIRQEAEKQYPLSDTIKEGDIYADREAFIVGIKSEAAAKYHAPKWISVNDAKPEFNNTVLCYCRIYGTFIGSYDHVAGIYGNWRRGDEFGILPPVKWMELPPVKIK